MFVLSNSDPEADNPRGNFFDAIYDQYFIKRVSAPRMINADPNGRGSVSEIMVSNLAQI